MPRVSKDSTEKSSDYGAVLERTSELDDHTVSFVTFREDLSLIHI